MRVLDCRYGQRPGKLRCILPRNAQHRGRRDDATYRRGEDKEQEPRVLWLMRLVAEGAFDREGLLRYPVRDPEGVIHKAER